MPMNISRRVFNAVVAAVPFVGVAAAQANDTSKAVCLSAHYQVGRRGRIINVTKRLVDNDELYYGFSNQASLAKALDVDSQVTLWGMVHYEPFEFVTKKEHLSMLSKGKDDFSYVAVPMLWESSGKNKERSFEECINASIDSSAGYGNFDAILLISRSNPGLYGIVVRPVPLTAKRKAVVSTQK